MAWLAEGRMLATGKTGSLYLVTGKRVRDVRQEQEGRLQALTDEPAAACCGSFHNNRPHPAP